MARPPRRPVSPGDRRVVAIFIGTAVVISAIAFAVTFWPRDEDETPPPTAAPTVAATATPQPPTPTVVAEALFTAPCPNACLIRLDDDAASRDALAERGLKPVFAGAGALWTGADTEAIEALRGGGTRVAVVSDAVATLNLYSIRTKSEGEEELVRGAGEIVDRVGNQYVVRVPKVPPPVRALTDVGIWIEKFPPVPAAQVADPSDDEPVPLTDDLLTDLVWSVDQDRLYESIVELQTMSSSDGSGVGTRHYTSTGNVMAAEYIYTTLASYGLNVWYEDFITYDGLLALNVVAELPGNDPSEVYLVLGHFDSLNPADLASSPGADDNATGVAAMLEIARLLSGYELAHPVRFFATNVEEVDLQGVKAFAARAAAEEVPIAGAFNVDAIGSAAHGSQIVFNTDESGVWLEDLLIRVNDQYGLGQDILAKVNPVIVADDNFLRDYGYPTVLIARELFGWSTLHHTIDDTVETVDLYNVRMAAALVLGAVANLVVT
jgi:hypothetical protein